MKYLSNYTEAKQTELFASTGAFFAFGDSQFLEQREEGVKYVNMGYGLLCPKPNVTKLIEGLDSIVTEGIKQDVEDNGAEAIIRREYFNHECHIVMDDSDARNKIEQYIELYPMLFTEELMSRVFKDSFDYAVENDMF